MIITTLVENTALSKEYECKHGLCLHIKTEKHNILFDVGPDDTFLKNANKLGVDISDVDILIISHGHKDHGGGLNTFLENNTKAKVYISRNAFTPHYTLVLGVAKHYIGLDERFKDSNRIVFTNDYYEIDEDIILFSGVKNNVISNCNKSLMKKENNKYIQDDFDHEQNLIINENNKLTLISGCAHSGIENIINLGNDILKCQIDYVIGGFHLFNPALRKSETKEYIENLGSTLQSKKIMYYTGHCTGVKSYNILKKILKGKIDYISTGSIIEI